MTAAIVNYYVVVFFVWQGRLGGERGTFQNASEMRQTCVKNARNIFGAEHLLDDTESISIGVMVPSGTS